MRETTYFLPFIAPTHNLDTRSRSLGCCCALPAWIIALYYLRLTIISLSLSLSLAHFSHAHVHFSSSVLHAASAHTLHCTPIYIYIIHTHTWGSLRYHTLLYILILYVYIYRYKLLSQTTRGVREYCVYGGTGPGGTRRRRLVRGERARARKSDWTASGTALSLTLSPPLRTRI